MKKVVFLLMVLLCFTNLMNGTEQPRKKVAVVLSGGSAKGFVHVGVLKVLEGAGIPIDYIAGTSIGAVVGGLYAVGSGRVSYLKPSEPTWATPVSPASFIPMPVSVTTFKSPRPTIAIGLIS